MRVGFALVFALSACASQPDVRALDIAADAAPERWFDVFTLPNFNPVGLAQRPTLKQVAKALPVDATTPLRIWFECKVSRTLTLTDCEPTRVWPNEASTIRAARSLLPAFRLISDANELTQPSATVLLTMYIDDDSRRLDRSCPRDWCPSIPPPPPPPRTGLRQETGGFEARLR
jgi:hypothetical protein